MNDDRLTKTNLQLTLRNKNKNNWMMKILNVTILNRTKFIGAVRKSECFWETVEQRRVIIYSVGRGEVKKDTLKK